MLESQVGWIPMSELLGGCSVVWVLVVIELGLECGRRLWICECVDPRVYECMGFGHVGLRCTYSCNFCQFV